MMENNKSIVSISEVDLRFSYLGKELFLVKASRDVSESSWTKLMVNSRLLHQSGDYIMLSKLNSTKEEVAYFIMLSKLNSTKEEVAYFISSTNTSCGIGGVVIVVESS